MIEEVLLHQLRHQFPLHILDDEIIASLLMHVPSAKVSCLSCFSCWSDFYKATSIDPLNSRQYAIFLAILSRSLYKADLHRASDIIAYLNKSVNGCEIYGHVPLRPNFMIGHTLGIVLGQAIYGDYLCLQHNVTIGRWMESYPCIGDRVVIMNGAVVAGNTNIGDNSIISAGVRIINQHVPANSIVFNGEGKELVFKPNKNNWIERWMA